MVKFVEVAQSKDLKIQQLTQQLVANQRDNAVALESEFTNLLKHKKLLLLKPPNANE